MSYILFDHDNIHIDFKFSEQELKDFKELWSSGISAENIAKQMKRRPLEIALLIIDRAEAGFIKMRATGIYGL